MAEGVKLAIEAGDVTREEMFITTKIWMDKYDKVVQHMDETLDLMGLEYVDAMLVHWPVCEVGDQFSSDPMP